MEVLNICLVMSMLGCTQALTGSSIFDKPSPTPLVTATQADSDLQRALDAALLTINKASDDTKNAAAFARARVDDIVLSLQAAADDALQSASNVVDLAGVYAVSSQIAAAVNSSAANINECLASRGAAFNNLTIQTGKDIVACVTDKIGVADDIVRDIVKLAGEAAAIGPNAIAAIGKCPGTTLVDLLPKLVCIAGEARKASEEAMRIVFELARNVARASELVATLQLDLQRCAALRVFEFILKAGHLAADAGLCVVQGLL